MRRVKEVKVKNGGGERWGVATSFRLRFIKQSAREVFNFLNLAILEKASELK